MPMIPSLAEDTLYLGLSCYQYQIRRKREAMRLLSPQGLDGGRELGRLEVSLGDSGTKAEDRNIFSFESNAAHSVMLSLLHKNPHFLQIYKFLCRLGLVEFEVPAISVLQRS